MELYKIIILSVLFLLPVLTILFSIIYIRKSNRAVRDSQSDLSDKALIEFINNQPDKIVNSQLLSDETELTKFEAGRRLRHLLSNGILNTLSTSFGMKIYYTLSRPIERPYDLELTDDAFMTIEDLMLIFKHNEYQVTLQEVCLSTGLPIKIIKEEMKYFEKEKVIKCLLKSINGGFSHQRVYFLCEPYRSNPDQYMKLKDINFELKEIYENVRKA